MSTNLKLMSWNLGAPPISNDKNHWCPYTYEKKLTDAVKLIVCHQPDLVLLQEVTFTENATFLTEMMEKEGYLPLASDWPTKPVIPYWLYPLVIPAISHFICSLNGDLTWRMNKGGLIGFLRKAGNWICLETTYLPFEKSAHDFFFLEGDGYNEKGIQRIHLRHASSGGDLIVYNTHLQAQYLEKKEYYSGIRFQQIAQLGMVGKMEPKEAVVLAAGDFNVCQPAWGSACKSPHDESIYRAIERDWKDLTKKTRTNCKLHCSTYVGEGEINQWLDYVLVRKSSENKIRDEKIEVLDSPRNQVPISDHRPIVVKFNIYFQKPQISQIFNLDTVPLIGLAGIIFPFILNFKKPVKRREVLTLLSEELRNRFILKKPN